MKKGVKIEEQIRELKDRGLIIKNEEKAKAIVPEALQQKTVVITIPRPVPKKKPMFTFLDEEAVQGGV